MGNEPRARPVWQTQPCPIWCTRVHRDDDHPEDRVHQDDGHVVAVVVAHIDADTLAHQPVSTEIVVQRVQRIDDLGTWLLVVEAEHRRAGWVLTAESAHRLSIALRAAS